MQYLKVAAVCAAFTLVAGCASNGSTSSNTVTSTNDGLSGTSDQFSRMTSPCIAQAARMTGLSRSQITVMDRIRTGGGPLLTLNAGGTKYSCRLEDNGTVSVFSEFAN